MKIVSYKPQYKSQIMDIFRSHKGVFAEFELPLIERDLDKEINNKCVKYIALEKDEVLGYLGAYKTEDSKDSFKLDWFAVKKGHQGKGTGSKLINTVIEELRKNDAPRLFVETCGCEDNSLARKFYEKVGFQKVGELPDFYNEGHSMLIYYQKLF